MLYFSRFFPVLPFEHPKEIAFRHFSFTGEYGKKSQTIKLIQIFLDQFDYILVFLIFLLNLHFRLLSGAFKQAVPLSSSVSWILGSILVAIWTMPFFYARKITTIMTAESYSSGGQPIGGWKALWESIFIFKSDSKNLKTKFLSALKVPLESITLFINFFQ